MRARAAWGLVVVAAGCADGRWPEALDGWFSSAAAPSTSALPLTLPRDGQGAMWVGGPLAQVAVYEPELTGESEPSGLARRYRHARGEVAWATHVEGHEEWLWLDRLEADGLASEWVAPGARFERRGEVATLWLGETPVAHVTAPSGVDATGEPLALSLEAEGERLRLRVLGAPRRFPVLLDPL